MYQIIKNKQALFCPFLLVTRKNTKNALSTLRYRSFAVGAYFEKVGDKIKLKIALTKKRRKWIATLWDFPLDLSHKIPIA